MFNVCTDGKKFWTLSWLRGHGQNTKIGCFSPSSLRKVPKSGQTSPTFFPTESVSSAESDGTIIWIPWSRKPVGLTRNNGFYTYRIAQMPTSGLTSQTSSKVERTTPSRTTGTLPWKSESEKCRTSSQDSFSSTSIASMLSFWVVKLSNTPSRASQWTNLKCPKGGRKTTSRLSWLLSRTYWRGINDWSKSRTGSTITPNVWVLSKMPLQTKWSVQQQTSCLNQTQPTSRTLWPNTKENC